MRIWTSLRVFTFSLTCLCACFAHAADVNENYAAALRAKHGALRDQLSRNQYQRPLYLESGDTTGSVTGNIHALINYPFATVSAALRSADNWCDVMMLHLNTKYCRASIAGEKNVITVSIGKKYDQPLKDAYSVVFSHGVSAQTPNYLRVQLDADEGPLSTRDYRILLEAIPLDSEQTLVRLSYSYGYGVVGRLAMQAYLGTIGSNRLGFTVIGKKSDGESLHIGGMRGVVERNTMRYRKLPRQADRS